MRGEERSEGPDILLFLHVIFSPYSGKLNLLSQTCEVKLEKRFVKLSRFFVVFEGTNVVLQKPFFCCFKAVSKTLNPPKGLTFRAPLSIVAEVQPENYL